MGEDTLNERIVRVEERCKSNTRQIEELKVRVKEVEDTTGIIHRMNANMESMCREMREEREYNKATSEEIKSDIRGMKKDISDVKGEIDVVKQAPLLEKANKWDKVSWQILAFVITGTLSALAGYLIK